MTTTQDLTTEVVARLAKHATVGVLPHELQPGQVVFDPALLPYTGLGYVHSVTADGLTVTIQFVLCTTDPEGPTASDDECEITWHSTLPIGTLPGITAGDDDGFWSRHDPRITKNIRSVTGCGELIDALDTTIF